MGRYVPTEWVDGPKFFALIEPYILYEPRSGGGGSWYLNGVQFPGKSKTRYTIQKLQKGQRKKLKIETAERILQEADLPLHELEDMRL